MPRHSTRRRDAPDRPVPEVASLPADQRERRDRIIDAAVEMMIEVDYTDIQVKDIARHAGVALGTLYRYFGSKDHLMTEALLAWSSRFPADRAGTRAEGTDPATQVAAVYLTAAKAFERSPRVYGALMQVQASSDPRAAARFADFGHRQTAAFAGALDTLDDDIRDDVVVVMDAVLSEGLRRCQSGAHTRAELRERIQRAAELLVSPARV